LGVQAVVLSLELLAQSLRVGSKDNLLVEFVADLSNFTRQSSSGGFGGIAVAAALVRAGFDDLVVLEKGDRIGGVWVATFTPPISSSLRLRADRMSAEKTTPSSFINGR